MSRGICWGGEFFDGREVVAGVMLVRVDGRHGCIGGETLGTYAEAVDVCRELGMVVTLGCCARLGRFGGQAGIVNGVGLEVELLDAVLGEHVDASLNEWVDVLSGVRWFGQEDELLKDGREDPEGGRIEVGQ